MGIKVIVVDDVSEMREMIDKMLQSSTLDYELVGLCDGAQSAFDLLSRSRVDIVLMDINMPGMNGLEATALITDKYPSVQVIMMSVQHESEYLKKAMLAGAKAYVMKPIDMDELVDTIRTTYDRRLNIEKQTPATQSHEAKIISFFSAKGGVGKTVTSLNLGGMLCDKYKKKVLLIDMDLQFGDVALMVNKQNELTIKELVDESPIKSIEVIMPYLFKFNQNFHMLFAPKDPESAEYISSDQIKNIIDILKYHYDIILIDTGVNYNDTTLSVLDVSDKVIVMTSLEVTSLKNTKLSLKVMQSLNYSNDKVKLLVSMATEKYGVTKANVQKAFSYDIIGYLPEDEKLVRNAINTGVPFFGSKNSSLYKPLSALCATLID